MRAICTLLLVVAVLVAGSPAAVLGAEEPGQRYLRAAAGKGVSPFDKKVYEQLAKIHGSNFLGFRGRLATAKGQPNDDAMDVIVSMGLDALPVLAEALDDRTPSQTPIYDSHRIPRVDKNGRVSAAALAEMRIGVRKVNELVATLICAIAEHSFTISYDRGWDNIQDVGQYPELAPKFKKLVLDWYAENANSPLK
jgi:hypothetical protein